MRLFAAVAVLVLIAAATASAQDPPSPAPAVSVNVVDDDGKVTVEGSQTFKVKVRNDGTPPPAGGQEGASDVVVSVAGVPAGWTAALIPSSFELANGQEREIDLQVSVGANAGAERADLVVTAEISSPFEGLDPILGQVPGASQKATATDTIRIIRDDSITRDILETVGPWIYAVLLLLVAAVLVAVGISLASRRALVRMSSDGRELTVTPGGRVAFPFTVEGLAKQDDAVRLQVSAVQEGWAAFLPVPELSLAPGQTQELSLVVISPKEAPHGARQAVLVSATSSKSPKGVANLEFIATVQSGTPLLAARRPKE